MNNLRKKQEFQDFVLKTQFMNNAQNKESFGIAQDIVLQVKLQCNSEERMVTNQTNLVRAMKQKTDDQILQEIKQRKIFEE